MPSLIRHSQLKWDLIGVKRGDPLARFGHYAQPLHERSPPAEEE